MGYETVNSEIFDGFLDEADRPKKKVEMNDEERKSKGEDEEDQAQDCSDDSLSDGVIPTIQHISRDVR